MKKAPPTFSYLQSAEKVWPNEGLVQGPQSERVLTAAGALAGFCVTNQCQLGLPLAPLLFQYLLRDRNGASNGQSYSAVEELISLDPSFMTTIDQVMTMNTAALRD